MIICHSHSSVPKRPAEYRSLVLVLSPTQTPKCWRCHLIFFVVHTFKGQAHAHFGQVHARVIILGLSHNPAFGGFDFARLSCVARTRRPLQEEHLTAACEDRSETTLLVIIDETCRWDPLERKLPTVCLTNVARTYPSNVARWVGVRGRLADCFDRSDTRSCSRTPSIAIVCLAARRR